MEKVYIGSQNPVKIEIIQKSFERVFPDTDAEFIGVDAPSGVSDQPMSDAETLKGADNRLDYIIQRYPDASYWAVMEGGMTDNLKATFGYVLIRHKYSSLLGKSRTAEVYLPRVVLEAVHNGKTLGEADDAFFGVSESGKKMGAVGLLTEGLITRFHLFEQAAIMSLMQLKHHEWFLPTEQD